MNNEKKYTLTVTEHQLHLIAECVEDCHRFMGGQYELSNMTSRLDNRLELQDRMRELKPLITPALPDPRASYGWDGSTCPNRHQRRFIAETYCIYREIYHMFRVLNMEKVKSYNVYDSETLTCDEGGVPPNVEIAKE